MAAQVALRRYNSFLIIRIINEYTHYHLNRQQITLNTNKPVLTMNNNTKYRNSNIFLQQKHLAIQKNLQQIQKSSITRNIIRSKTLIFKYEIFRYWFSVWQDLQTQNLKIRNNHIDNTFLTSTNSYLNDRIRKRRCFADKELDNAFILPSFMNTTMINSTFHMTHYQKAQQHLCDRTKSNQKKCTDFSVAAIIGNS